MKKHNPVEGYLDFDFNDEVHDEYDALISDKYMLGVRLKKFLEEENIL